MRYPLSSVRLCLCSLWTAALALDVGLTAGALVLSAARYPSVTPYLLALALGAAPLRALTLWRIATALAAARRYAGVS